MNAMTMIAVQWIYYAHVLPRKWSAPPSQSRESGYGVRVWESPAPIYPMRGPHHANTTLPTPHLNHVTLPTLGIGLRSW